MKIVADNKIPYLKGALESFAEVVYLPGKETTPDVVKNADAIITRTRTKCNEALLKGSSVKMIATATIGYDHIDTAYCEANNIEWTNAPGCNSWSVAQYIMAALHHLANQRSLELAKMTIGIVGAGNVGSKVAKLCNIIGMKVLMNDPPRMRAEGTDGFVPIETIQQQADIITFHTPLTRSGEDKTFHLFNNDFMLKCKEGLIFINSSRGEVMDTDAVIAGSALGFISEAIIDCWENEPDINRHLLERAFIATPHIAGYSKDGKANGTSMSVQAISRKFNLGIDHWQCENVELPANTTIQIDAKNKSSQQIVAEAVLATYPIWEDSERLKQSPETFENQRGEYPVRREFPVYTVKLQNHESEVGEILKLMGFSISAK
ncbi:MAG: 4-phosphoerythronate dehydrogenase PdxB [Prolixibacteraceae bacterium]|jgi:erythronate-4-phosphate dehydrogenase|nr:4-phosphoerythronate dehydrogenase PdxB [Prolixibacteraceae bacterium]